MIAADFPALFASGWAMPKPEPFLDFFLPIIDPEATFTQPMFPDAHGRAEIEAMFRRLFALFPDVVVTPHRSAVSDDVVFIESEGVASLRTRPVRFWVCDRFVMRGGQIVERKSYSEVAPLVRAIARSPLSWPRLVRSRVG